MVSKRNVNFDKLFFFFNPVIIYVDWTQNCTFINTGKSGISEAKTKKQTIINFI